MSDVPTRYFEIDMKVVYDAPDDAMGKTTWRCTVTPPDELPPFVHQTIAWLEQLRRQNIARNPPTMNEVFL